jgi:flavin reductase (DIM6/NTAB) family NADH-FMN oxidoreductase RutF
MTISHPKPPAVLDSPLEVTTDEWSSGDIYHLLTGLVIPRPIAWISTLSANGVPNLAPHSFFNVMGYNPPIVAFCSTGRKDTLSNIEATGEFVVNIPTMELVEYVNLSATDFPPDEDEFVWCGLEAAPSAVVAPPRVAKAPAHLECRHHQTVTIGEMNIVIAQVVHIHVSPSVWKDGRISAELLDPLARLGGSDYAGLGRQLKLPRRKWETDVRLKTPGAILKTDERE